MKESCNAVICNIKILNKHIKFHGPNSDWLTNSRIFTIEVTKKSTTFIQNVARDSNSEVQYSVKFVIHETSDDAGFSYILNIQENHTLQELTMAPFLLLSSFFVCTYERNINKIKFISINLIVEFLS